MKQEEDFGGSTKSERGGLGNKIQGEAGGCGGGVFREERRRQIAGMNRKRDRQ